MPYMRVWRWRLAATSLQSVEPNLELIVATLAVIDQDLYLRDQRHKKMSKDPSSTKLTEWATVWDAVGLSYLWILGAYEAVRTIDQRFREMASNATKRHAATSTLKHKYERIRVPLAKMEPSHRNRHTDFAFPRPGIDDGHGIAWEVAGGVAISRSELSDDFLALLESLQNGSLSN